MSTLDLGVETCVPKGVSFASDFIGGFEGTEVSAAVLRSLVTLDEHYAQGHVPKLETGGCEACDVSKKPRNPVRRTVIDKDLQARRYRKVAAADLQGPMKIAPFGRLSVFDAVCETRPPRHRPDVH